MRFVSARDFWHSFANQGVGNDELWFPVIALFRDVERVEKLLHVLAVNLLDIESVSLETRARILAFRLLGRSIERDGVGIVNQN